MSERARERDKVRELEHVRGVQASKDRGRVALLGIDEGSWEVT